MTELGERFSQADSVRETMAPSGRHWNLQNYLGQILSTVDDIEWQRHQLNGVTRDVFGIGIDRLTDTFLETRNGDLAAVRLLWLMGFDEPEILEFSEGSLNPDTLGTLIARYEGGSAREIYGYHLEGLTPPEISVALSVARSRVYQILDEVDVQANITRRRIDEGDRAKMVKLYEKGFTLSGIADEFDYSLSVVKGALRTAARRGDLPTWGTRALTFEGAS